MANKCFFAQPLLRHITRARLSRTKDVKALFWRGSRESASEYMGSRGTSCYADRVVV
jgi:hypothetical protein